MSDGKAALTIDLDVTNRVARMQAVCCGMANWGGWCIGMVGLAGWGEMRDLDGGKARRVCIYNPMEALPPRGICSKKFVFACQVSH
jgi:hypothetical protein